MDKWMKKNSAVALSISEALLHSLAGNWKHLLLVLGCFKKILSNTDDKFDEIHELWTHMNKCIIKI